MQSRSLLEGAHDESAISEAEAAGCKLRTCVLPARHIGRDGVGEPASGAASGRETAAARARQWTEAEDKSDLDALRRILDDRFVATLGAARTYDKEGFIKLFDRDVDPSASQATTYEAVISDGDTVVVGTDTARGTRDGAAHTAVYKYTVTYIRRDGRWRALAEHIVKAPPP